MFQVKLHFPVYVYVICGLLALVGIWLVLKEGIDFIFHAFFFWIGIIAFLTTDVTLSLDERSSRNRRQ